MIRKLRLQFVAICMLLVSLVLGTVFFVGFSSIRTNIESTSRQLLRRVIQEDESPVPGNRKHELFPSDGQVQLPYFTVEIWGGKTVYITGGTYGNLEDTEELSDILIQCLQQEEQEGVLQKYQLRYLRQGNSLFLRIAFVDMSMEQSTLRNMIRGYVLIGFLAMLLLLGVSIVLSWWVTRPVERAWQQQRQFLSDASHELKTPLTVILSNAALLETAPLDSRPARWVDNIREEADRMKTLVEEMLTLARADNMTHIAVLEELSLSELAMDSALSFEPVAFEAGKPLEYELTEQVQVLGDPEKLRRVIAILLDNAIKYGAEAQPVRMTLTAGDRTARLCVVNEGEPIPPEQLSHLFERFYRADASRGEKVGFGLGLSIAAAIVKEHNGTLKAESVERIIRFTLTLPLKRG